MSDPSLGSERSLADYREENSFDAYDRFLGASREKRKRIECRPQHPLSIVSWEKQGISVHLTV
jgi:hypothetical protein